MTTSGRVAGAGCGGGARPPPPPAAAVAREAAAAPQPLPVCSGGPLLARPGSLAGRAWPAVCQLAGACGGTGAPSCRPGQAAVLPDRPLCSAAGVDAPPRAGRPAAPWLLGNRSAAACQLPSGPDRAGPGRTVQGRTTDRGSGQR
jgi:hypothetical protein